MIFIYIIHVKLYIQMLSSGDSERHREHLEVSQTKQTKNKKSRITIDSEDVA